MRRRQQQQRHQQQQQQQAAPNLLPVMDILVSSNGLCLLCQSRVLFNTKTMLCVSLHDLHKHRLPISIEAVYNKQVRVCITNDQATLCQ